MNTAPHLLPEDRPEFERAVDEALRDAGRRPALAAVGEQISAQQLRVMALSSATAIAADAAEEYERYVALRTRLREPAVGASRDSFGDSSSGSPSGAARPARDGKAGDGEAPGAGGELSLAGVSGGVSETAGAGLLAMISVLVPLLAGSAAVIFLLLGNLLRVVSPEPSIAAPMRGAGWVFAVLAAAGIVVAMTELWLTAVRNGAGALRSTDDDVAAADDGTDGESRLAKEVSAARAVWREALLERGIVPFLANVLADLPGGEQSGAAGTGPVDDGREPDGREPDGRGAASPPVSGPEKAHSPERTPRLGYSGPDFSSRSPSDGKESVRPRYSSPDYSSPDYGGPEHKPE